MRTRKELMMFACVAGLFALMLPSCQKGGAYSLEAAKEKLNQLKASGRINEVSAVNFIYCAQMGDVEAVEAYLASGMDVNVKNNLGRTPLMGAAAAASDSPWYPKNAEIVKLLLKSGADVNAKDNDGNTALKMATDMGRPAIAQLLKEAETKK